MRPLQTLIECLRYATTEELPPNTEKRAFVHDPRVAHEREVSMQIKLQFIDIQGRSMTVTRVGRVVVQPNGETRFHTLDGTVHYRNRETGQVCGAECLFAIRSTFFDRTSRSAIDVPISIRR